MDLGYFRDLLLDFCICHCVRYSKLGGHEHSGRSFLYLAVSIQHRSPQPDVLTCLPGSPTRSRRSVSFESMTACQLTDALFAVYLGYLSM
jgi:hypothetical protein